MLKIGLTGGIGCGKTTVTRLFEQLNIPVIDADVIAHQCVEPGQPVLDILKDRFGTHILQSNGQLNRAFLRDQVFSSPQQKKLLESIMHPLIYQRIDEHVKTLGHQHPYCILSIPLLLETKQTRLVDRVLVIDCPEAQQRQRVRQRDQLSDARIDSIIASQVSRKQRLSQADDIIDNSDSLDSLAEQVKKLHNQYLNLS